MRHRLLHWIPGDGLRFAPTCSQRSIQRSAAVQWVVKAELILEPVFDEEAADMARQDVVLLHTPGLENAENQRFGEIFTNVGVNHCPRQLHDRGVSLKIRHTSRTRGQVSVMSATAGLLWPIIKMNREPINELSAGNLTLPSASLQASWSSLLMTAHWSRPRNGLTSTCDQPCSFDAVSKAM